MCNFHLTLVDRFFPLHKNANEAGPGHLCNLNFILCGHFDGKKKWGYPKDRGRVGHQSLGVGVVAIRKILCCHFE